MHAISYCALDLFSYGNVHIGYNNNKFISIYYIASGILTNNWENFTGHGYKYFANSTISANDAAKACIEQRGLLTSINTKEEMDFIANNVLRRRTLSAYIGGSNVPLGQQNF